VPSQIRALRMKSDTPRQSDLAEAARMHQSRISMLETAGANPTLGTLSAIAAALRVGLKVEFVPFSEMLAWENNFSQDQFVVATIDDDLPFLNPAAVTNDLTIPIVAMAASPTSLLLPDAALFYRPARTVSPMVNAGVETIGGFNYSMRSGDVLAGMIFSQQIIWASAHTTH
jgi:transcriptional regulator with XRE-family HTH domain